MGTTIQALQKLADLAIILSISYEKREIVIIPSIKTYDEYSIDFL